MAAKNGSTLSLDRTLHQHSAPPRPLHPGAGIALGIILGLFVWSVLISVAVMVFGPGEPL